MGSRVSPYRRYCGQHTFLQGRSRLSRTPRHRDRLRLQYGTAMSAPSGANTAPVTLVVPTHPPVSHRVRGFAVPTKPPHRVFRITACLPPLPRLLIGEEHWIVENLDIVPTSSSYLAEDETPRNLRQSTEAFGRVAHIFCMTVDVDLEVDSRPALLFFFGASDNLGNPYSCTPFQC